MVFSLHYDESMVGVLLLLLQWCCCCWWCRCRIYTGARQLVLLWPLRLLGTVALAAASTVAALDSSKVNGAGWHWRIREQAARLREPSGEERTH